MADRTPIETRNLDMDGNAPLPWSRPRELFAGIFFGRPSFLGTIRPDGRPHAAGVATLWLDGEIYFTSGPETRKSRNLGRESSLHDLRQSGNHRHCPRGRGAQGDRRADPGATGSTLPGGRLAGAGRRRRLHCPVQRAERRTSAVAPLPFYLPHRHRQRHNRAEWSDALAIRALSSGKMGRRPTNTLDCPHYKKIATLILRVYYLFRICHSNIPSAWPIGTSSCTYLWVRATDVRV